MRSWRSRLLMVLTTLAVVLVVSVPAMADDVEVKCEADGGFCKDTLSYSSDQYEDDGSALGDTVVDPVIVDTEEDCFPFCGLDWWPW
jgi:predicted secreted protein